MEKSKIDKVLTEIYYNPLEGLVGVTNLYRKAKKKLKSITMKQVKEWYKRQSTTQIHYRTKKKISYLPIFSYKSGAFQMDLTEMKRLSSKNKGFKYILTAINVNTRKLYAYRSKSKNAGAIKQLLKQFKDDVISHNETFKTKNRVDVPLTSVTTDAGSEFLGNKKWFEDNEVQLIIVNPSNKKYITSKIERVHRTLKELFNKYFTAFQTATWYDILDDFVSNYNNRYHATIKQEPNQVGKRKRRK